MEVFFPEWLANPVLVLKKNKQWRMCIDYTSLNKACPKDPFALPRIDQVIDSTAGCELLSFLDAYSGYHQIKLNPADRLKTAFITPFGAIRGFRACRNCGLIDGIFSGLRIGLLRCGNRRLSRDNNRCD
jgi:hypothetical protein